MVLTWPRMAVPGLLDTDLGLLGATAAKVLGFPFTLALSRVPQREEKPEIEEVRPEKAETRLRNDTFHFQLAFPL